jgi:hypothetical protein
VRAREHYIVVFAQKRWPCARHQDEHMETRGIVHMDGENLTRCGIGFRPHAEM